MAFKKNFSPGYINSACRNSVLFFVKISAYCEIQTAAETTYLYTYYTICMYVCTDLTALDIKLSKNQLCEVNF